MDEDDIQETIRFARLIIEDPDMLGRDIYEATDRKSVNEIEAHLIKFRKLDDNRYSIDGCELHLVIVMLLGGSSDAEIRKRIASIRRKYPITARYPDYENQQSESCGKLTSISD